VIAPDRFEPGVADVDPLDLGSERPLIEPDEQRTPLAGTAQDARLEPVWGDHVSRVVLRAMEPRAQGAWTLTMTAEGARP
jgi:hypothetical protein